ncbi:MAG: TldD/PmbA family protein [Candidatus Schekmanbacteria bacterium]|nr:MAG: TldD/PmbA family protein [Candidatus Schekmanbacteria bacterium]
MEVSMKKSSQKKLISFFLIIISFFLAGWFQGTETKKPEKIIKIMEDELNRSMKKLKLPDFQPPYFISYLMRESQLFSVSAKYGAIFSKNKRNVRSIYCETRVGNYKFDSSSVSGSPFGFSKDYSLAGMYGFSSAPIDDDERAIRTSLWLLTDSKYKRALSSYLKKKSEKIFKVDKEEEELDDFSREESDIFISKKEKLEYDEKKIIKTLRYISSIFNEYPEITNSGVEAEGRVLSKYFVNSEGQKFFTSYPLYMSSINATLITEDGEALSNQDVFYDIDPDSVVDKQRLEKRVRKLISELKALSKAEKMDPYAGPAILSPKVTGVFFHEAIGHRLEGERQRTDEEGQTFKGKVGKKIIPEFLTVEDDPTLKYFNGVHLNGFYEYDDEGVKAQKVELIKDGVLKNFLLSRTPIKGFNKSNGHGRASGQRKPMGRMANLIIKSSKEYSADELKRMLIEEAKKRGKKFGLIIRDIEGGGETSTSRRSFQAFRSTPKLVYKVDVETGEETLVRGVEIVGTPLISINRIIATGKDYEVFNGYCGAESGSVPVSTVAPSVLIEEIELQRKPLKKTRPPILEKPQIEINQ